MSRRPSTHDASILGPPRQLAGLDEVVDVPHQRGEDHVGWLTSEDDDSLRELLAVWSPRHDVDPGDPDVRRWAGRRNRRLGYANDHHFTSGRLLPR